MAYFIRPFTVQRSEQGYFVFAAGGVHTVSSDPMHAVLADLMELQNAVLGEAEFDAIITRHGVDPQLGLDFLREDLALLVHAPAKDMGGDVLIFTDLPNMGGMLADCLMLPKTCRVQLVGDGEDAGAHPACVILMQSDYREQRVRELYGRYAGCEGVSFVNAYLHQHLLVIDGPYIPDRGLPCHFCHRHHFAKGDCRRWSVRDSSWLSMKNLLEQNGVIVPSEVPLTSALEGMVAFSLKTELEALLGIGGLPRLGGALGSSLQIDLRTGEQSRDKVLHWAACECHKGAWA